MIHDAVLPSYLTLAEVYAALPVRAAPIDSVALGQKLHARAGNVMGACEKLFDAGCAGRTNDFRYYRVPGAEVPEGRFAAWGTGSTGTKRMDAIGNIATEAGALAPRRLAEPLKLYGEDPKRPRPKLPVIRQLSAIVEAHAKARVVIDLDLIRKDGGESPEALSVIADAHELAAEMLRARANRLRTSAPPPTVAAE